MGGAFLLKLGEKLSVLKMQRFDQGNPNGGLARKAPIGPKRALSGQFLILPVDVRCGGIGPDHPPKKALINGPQSAPKRPPDFLSENLGLKSPFVSPHLDFPNLKTQGHCDF